MAENFMDVYINHTRIYETPLSFWKWSGYSVISTLLRDRCYKRDGDRFLFPNLYILFLAESSGHRKNRPVELAEQIINKAVSTVKTLSGRASVQAILDDLARTESDPKTGKVIKSNSATFYAPELSAGIVNDPEGLKILTDIFDCKPNPYKSRLRTGPNFNLDRIVFSMLSASNAAMLDGIFDRSTIEGGFLARTLLICPSDAEFRKSNSLLRINHDMLKASLENVVEHAKKILTLNGEFKFPDETIDAYEEWYDPFRQDYRHKKEVSGIVGRIHTHILKLGMVLAANDLTLCVQKKHILLAIEECCNLLKNYNIFTMNHTKTDVGNVGGTVITELLSAKDHMLSRKQIVRAHWQNFDVEMLDKAVAALEVAGMIKLVSVQNEIFFQLTKHCLEMLE